MVDCNREGKHNCELSRGQCTFVYSPLELGGISRIIGCEIDQGRGMSVFETTEVIVRRILTDYLGRDAQSLGEQFRWIDEVAPEDQSWFLHEIEYRFEKTECSNEN